jgi:hypothetical protein
MTINDLYPLFEADRGTLATSGRNALFKTLQAQGLDYVPYTQRVGLGFATAASELKRALDTDVLPLFQSVVGAITEQRFSHVYCDVRLYPQGQELAQWTEGHWAGERLTVLVTFVLAIPPDDSLDSLVRASLLSLFEESSWDPKVKKLGKKGKLGAHLNVDAINALLSNIVLDGFNPYDLDGFEMEIMIDGCPHSRFNRLRTDALGQPILKARSGRTVFKGEPAPITLENANKEVPVLIAALAKALGIKRIDPTAILASDSLYSLMGFDDKLTKSLVASIRMHFDVFGGPRMFTVNDAIVFAKEMLEMREDE